MNRTIKFKFWNWNKKEMVAGVPAMNLTIGHLGVNAYVPLQFSGLWDKNKKEIWEGDVIIFEDAYGQGGPHKGVVEYFEGAFRENSFRSILGERKSYTIEVIGNKFENPELIKTNGTVYETR